jgi:hypothetical protein
MNPASIYACGRWEIPRWGNLLGRPQLHKLLSHVEEQVPDTLPIYKGH